MEKKLDPGRFTIRLDLQNPETRLIAELLNRLGRKKGQYIVRAILYYIDAPRSGAGEQGYSILPELPQTPESEQQRSKRSPARGVGPNKLTAKPLTAPQNTALSPEAERALQSALAAFEI